MFSMLIVKVPTLEMHWRMRVSNWLNALLVENSINGEEQDYRVRQNLRERRIIPMRKQWTCFTYLMKK
jgi:hypothetical protein